ncbi:hypothetical protein PVAG01_01969 [Phlyctema vagabunda]|uniref:Uncharacterized protein n=1 Tax=Phlyctema vagabunda TaxID=108571 RepID=A0ABR4PYM1_9HELO
MAESMNNESVAEKTSDMSSTVHEIPTNIEATPDERLENGDIAAPRNGSSVASSSPSGTPPQVVTSQPSLIPVVQSQGNEAATSPSTTLATNGSPTDTISSGKINSFWSPPSPHFQRPNRTSTGKLSVHVANTMSALRVKPPKPGTVAQWGLEWYHPVSMIGLMGLGIIAMLSHHFLNWALDGHLVGDPQWPQRGGLALAFFAKVCLITSIEIAYRQVVWLFVGRNDYEIKTLDALFSLIYRPLKFANPELILRATLPVFLAAICWILPLSAIVSPASLTSISGLLNSTMNCSINSMDFSRENGYNIDTVGALGEGLSFFSLDPNDNYTFYYNSASADLQKYTQLALLSDSGYLDLPNPCESGSNCSYAYSFIGPAYNCQARPDFSAATNLNKSLLIPEGEYLYITASDTLEDPWGRPAEWQYMQADNQTDVGTFFAEPSLWLGYSINSTEPLTDVTSDALWHYRMDQYIYQCTLYNATYDYTIDFMNGLMSIENSTVNFISPLIEPGGPQRPTDPEYGEFAAFHVVAWLFRQAISGNLTMEYDQGPNAYVISNSEIGQTSGIVDPNNSMPPIDLPQRVQDQLGKILLSLAANPNFYSQINITDTCFTTNMVLKWNYKPFWLVLAYTLSAAATIIAMGIGLYAFRANGYCADTNFSTFLTTTRNPTLDRLSEGCCLGQAKLPRDLMKQRLTFGQLKITNDRDVEDGDISHIAFGLPNETTKLVYGKKYV